MVDEDVWGLVVVVDVNIGKVVVAEDRGVGDEVVWGVVVDVDVGKVWWLKTSGG